MKAMNGKGSLSMGGVYIHRLGKPDIQILNLWVGSASLGDRIFTDDAIMELKVGEYKILPRASSMMEYFDDRPNSRTTATIDNIVYSGHEILIKNQRIFVDGVERALFLEELATHESEVQVNDESSATEEAAAPQANGMSGAEELESARMRVSASALRDQGSISIFQQERTTFIRISNGTITNTNFTVFRNG